MVEASSVPVSDGVVVDLSVGAGRVKVERGYTMKYSDGGNWGKVYAFKPILFQMSVKLGVSGGTRVLLASNQSKQFNWMLLRMWTGFMTLLPSISLTKRSW